MSTSRTVSWAGVEVALETATLTESQRQKYDAAAAWWMTSSAMRSLACDRAQAEVGPGKRWELSARGGFADGAERT